MGLPGTELKSPISTDQDGRPAADWMSRIRVRMVRAWPACTLEPEIMFTSADYFAEQPSVRPSTSHHCSPLLESKSDKNTASLGDLVHGQPIFSGWIYWKSDWNHIGDLVCPKSTQLPWVPGN